MKITESTTLTRNTLLQPVDINGHLGMLSTETGKYIVLNTVGARIWDLTAEPVSVMDIVSMLTEEFDVSLDDCRRQVLPYLENLMKEKLIGITSI